MTKRNADEHEKYNVKEPTEHSTETPQFSVLPAVPVQGHYIALSHREYYVWQRNGGPAAVRHLIAPEGLCAQCEEARTDPSSYHGWFCTSCQRTLANLGQLPPKLHHS